MTGLGGVATIFDKPWSTAKSATRFAVAAEHEFRLPERAVDVLRRARGHLVDRHRGAERRPVARHVGHRPTSLRSGTVTGAISGSMHPAVLPLLPCVSRTLDDEPVPAPHELTGAAPRFRGPPAALRERPDWWGEAEEPG